MSVQTRVCNILIQVLSNGGNILKDSLLKKFLCVSCSCVAILEIYFKETKAEAFLYIVDSIWAAIVEHDLEPSPVQTKNNGNI